MQASVTRHSVAPTLDEIEIIARHAFLDLPQSFRSLVKDVVFRVEDFPDPATEQEMALQSSFELMGLYRGTPIGMKDGGVSADIDMVFLYRRPILDYWCETEEDLSHLVRHVVIHEIGHHFGLSDEDMEAIERGLESP